MSASTTAEPRSHPGSRRSNCPPGFTLPAWKTVSSGVLRRAQRFTAKAQSPCSLPLADRHVQDRGFAATISAGQPGPAATTPAQPAAGPGQG
eukprot:14889061-Heterocapsa_arctica.AAC.1